MNLTLTQWFAPNVMPVHKGVYQRGVPTFSNNMTVYAYWDGMNWYVSSSTVQGARRYKSQRKVSVLNHASWRGIAEEPI